MPTCPIAGNSPTRLAEKVTGLTGRSDGQGVVLTAQGGSAAFDSVDKTWSGGRLVPIAVTKRLRPT